MFHLSLCSLFFFAAINVAEDLPTEQSYEDDLEILDSERVIGAADIPPLPKLPPLPPLPPLPQLPNLPPKLPMLPKLPALPKVATLTRNLPSIRSEKL